MSASDSVGATLRDARVVVTCGAGGVGKTTIAAAIGVHAAESGRRVAVVTIDPARRLATALGLGSLGDEPHRVDAVPGDGALWALQLDAKATFDRLVARHAKDAETRDRILANRIYRHLSSGVAGAQEFMAVERLHELLDDPRFDLIVLDTPPATNALAFLDAPIRMVQFIEGRGLKLLVRPVGRASRLIHAGSALVFSLLERITGAQLLREISEFLVACDGLYEGIRERANAVAVMLHDGSTRFVVVTGPTGEPSTEAQRLWTHLATAGYPLAACVVNRVTADPGPGVADAELVRLLHDAGAGDAADLARRVREEASRTRERATWHREAVARIAAFSAPLPLAIIHERSDAPTDISGLADVGRAFAT